MNKTDKVLVMQVIIDEDVNIGESNPDIAKILKISPIVYLDNLKTGEDKIYPEGRFTYSILYLSENEYEKISSISGSINFYEQMNIPEKINPGKCKIDIEDISIKLINSRKLSIKAILLIKLTPEDLYDEEIIESIEGDGVEILNKTMEISRLVVNKSDILRIKNELNLPNDKPNINKIIYKEIHLKACDYRCIENAIDIKGEIKVFIIYEGDNKNTNTLESTLSYGGKIDINGIKDDMIACVDAVLGASELEIREDSDGESRVFGIDGVVDLNIKVYEDDAMEIMCDAYSLFKDIEMETENVEFDKILIKNYSKCKVSKNITVAGKDNHIMQVCHSDCVVRVDEINILEEQLEVLGLAELKILYIKDDDKEPMGLIETAIPFKHLIEIGKTGKNIEFTVNPYVEQISTNMAAEEIEVRLVIGLDGLVKEKSMKNIVKHAWLKDYIQENMKAPIIAYVTKENESLWDIAKKYRTTRDNIKKVNNLNGEKIESGKKLIILSRPTY